MHEVTYDVILDAPGAFTEVLESGDDYYHMRDQVDVWKRRLDHQGQTPCGRALHKTAARNVGDNEWRLNIADGTPAKLRLRTMVVDDDDE